MSAHDVVDAADVLERTVSGGQDRRALHGRTRLEDEAASSTAAPSPA